jgi:hypothetical protein
MIAGAPVIDDEVIIYPGACIIEWHLGPAAARARGISEDIGTTKL